MTKRIKKTDNWIIVDSKGNIIETFRLHTTARFMKPKLEKIYLEELTIKRL